MEILNGISIGTSILLAVMSLFEYVIGKKIDSIYSLALAIFIILTMVLFLGYNF